MSDPIIILGKEIDEERMPALYQWAKRNPKYLEEVILKTSKAQNEPIETTMAIMENEYQGG